MSFTTSWVMEVVDQSSGALRNIGTEAETMGAKIESSAQKSSTSLKDVGTAMSGVATSAFALYNIYDRIDDAQLRVDTASNRLADAHRRVEFAQTDLAAAVEKYGYGSIQAAEASERLKAAQEDVALAQERAQEAQERFNESLFLSGTMAIPAVITMITSLKTAAATLGPMLSGVAGGFSAAAAASAGLVAAGAAIIGTMVGLGASIVAWKEQTGDWHSATEKVIERLQTFPPIIKELTEFLAKAAGGWLIAFDKIKEGAMKLGSSISGFASQVSAAFSSAGSAISGAVSYISSSLSGVISVVSSVWSGIVNVVSSTVSSVVNVISSGFSSALSVISNVFSGMWSIVSSTLGGIVSYVWSVVNSIVSAIQSLWATLTGHSIWPEMFESMEKQAAYGMKDIAAAMDLELGEIPPMIQNVAPTGPAGPTTSYFDISFTIQGVTDPDAVARAVEDRLVEVLSRRSEVTAG